MLKIKDWCATEYLDMFGRSYIGKKGHMMAIDHRIDRIYSWYASHREEARRYLLAEKVVKRVEDMDISGLTAEMILAVTGNHNSECGVILDPAGQSVKVSSTFLISNDCILMEVFVGSFGNARTERYANGQEDLSQFQRRFVGSVVISSLGIERFPCNALALLGTRSAIKVERSYGETLRRILREIQRVSSESTFDIRRLVKDHPGEMPVTKGQYEDYCHKVIMLDYALKAFLFIHTSETLKADRISEGGGATAKASGCIRDYILVDSLWDTEVNVLNPFAVKGHFTHQPYGKGRALRKLMYIEPYYKKGYHRRAGRDLAKEQE